MILFVEIFANVKRFGAYIFTNSSARVKCDTRSILLVEFNRFESGVFLLQDKG